MIAHKGKYKPNNEDIYCCRAKCDKSAFMTKHTTSIDKQNAMQQSSQPIQYKQGHKKNGKRSSSPDLGMKTLVQCSFEHLTVLALFTIQLNSKHKFMLCDYVHGIHQIG